FGRLVGIHEVGKPAELIAGAAEALASQTKSAPIIVDNARLLDPLSATLVYHLAQEAANGNGSPLIVTVRSVLRAPRVVSALWEDGLLRRVDVLPLDGAETAAVVSGAGGDSRHDTAAVLYRRSAGNPLHLRMLLATGGSDETLNAAIDHYLSELPAGGRDVLGYLCVFEPTSRDDLVALTDETRVQAAIDAGVAADHDRMVYSGHPLFLERLAVSLGRDEIARRRTALAAHLSAQPSPTQAERLRHILLTLQGAGPVDTAAAVSAAEQVLRLGDLGLAERLARGALEHADSLEARLALSYALAWQGRGREADSVLGAVDVGALSEEQLMAWALPRAANQFWMLSEPERATTFLQNVRGRVGATSSHLTLDALSATFAMNAGNVHRAVEIAEQVLLHPDAPDMAVAWAASAASLSRARMGRLEAVWPTVQRALGAEYPGLLRFTVGLAETSSLLMAGDTEQALATARSFTDFAELAQPGRAIGEVLLAQVLLARGEDAEAAALMAPAAATLERTGYSWGPLALMYLTTALAHLGEIPESAKALARAQSRHGTKSALFAPELGIARAWRLTTIGDHPGALTAARGAARMAERGGQCAVAVRAWHEAVRLGDRRAGQPLAAIAEAQPDLGACAYTRMALAHARALTAGDAAGLSAVAADLAAAGFAGAAADARRQAQDAS
ncbi:MAG: AAA family ATPase, partial [Mycobacteriaceae bacterium]